MAKKSKRPVDGVTNAGGRAVTRGKATAKQIESFADSVIETVAPGYRLRVPPDFIDLVRFAKGGEQRIAAWLAD